MKIRIDLPERDAEIEVLNRHAAGFDPRDLDGAGLRAGGRTGRPRGGRGGRSAR